MEKELNKQKVIKSFKQAKLVFMITYGKNNERHSRPMTNINENPYSKMWFPSFTNNRKVNDLKQNPKTLILFPDENKTLFYEIEGHATLASKDIVDEKWFWWYLYWHPEQAERFWFDPVQMHPERCIIDVNPVSVKTLSMNEMEEIHGTYKSMIPRNI